MWFLLYGAQVPSHLTGERGWPPFSGKGTYGVAATTDLIIFHWQGFETLMLSSISVLTILDLLPRKLIFDRIVVFHVPTAYVDVRRECDVVHSGGNISAPPDDHDEHDIWFDSDTGRNVKG